MEFSEKISGIPPQMSVEFPRNVYTEKYIYIYIYTLD